MVLSKFGLHRFQQKYNDVYRALKDRKEYRGWNKVYDYQKAIDVGDEILTDKNYKDLIAQLVNERGDYFSSDIEVAALAIALDQMNIGITHTKNMLSNLEPTEGSTALPSYTDEEEEYYDPHEDDWED